MVGILLSCWEGIFLGAMLNFGRVSLTRSASTDLQAPPLPQPPKIPNNRHAHTEHAVEIRGRITPSEERQKNGGDCSVP